MRSFNEVKLQSAVSAAAAAVRRLAAVSSSYYRELCFTNKVLRWLTTIPGIPGIPSIRVALLVHSVVNSAQNTPARYTECNNEELV
jgi:hypothetical protein